MPAKAANAKAVAGKPSQNTLQASMNSIYSLEHPFHPNIHEVKGKKERLDLCFFRCEIF